MKIDLQKIDSDNIMSLKAKLVNLQTLTSGKNLKEINDTVFKFFCQNFTCKYEKMAIDSLTLFCLGEKSNFDKFMTF